MLEGKTVLGARHGAIPNIEQHTLQKSGLRCSLECEMLIAGAGRYTVMKDSSHGQPACTHTACTHYTSLHETVHGDAEAGGCTLSSMQRGAGSALPCLATGHCTALHCIPERGGTSQAALFELHTSCSLLLSRAPEPAVEVSPRIGD